MPKFVKKDKLYVPLRSDKNFSSLIKPPAFTPKARTLSELHPVTLQWVNSFKSNFPRIPPSPETVIAHDNFWKSLSPTIRSKMIYIITFPPEGIGIGLVPFYHRNYNGAYFSSNNGFVDSDLNKNGLKGDGAGKYLYDSAYATDFNTGWGASILVTEVPEPFAGDTSYFGLTNDSSGQVSSFSLSYNGDVVWEAFGALSDNPPCDNVIYWGNNPQGLIAVNIDTDTNRKTLSFGQNGNFSNEIDFFTCLDYGPPTESVIPIFAKRNFYYVEDEDQNLVDTEDIYNYSNARLGFVAFHDFMEPYETEELYAAIVTLRRSLGGDVF